MLIASRKRHIIAIDLDGTLIDSAWPQMGDWKPGAVEAVRRFQKEGYAVYVYTARVNQFWLDGSRRLQEDTDKAIQEVREKLDEAGLASVQIKPKESFSLLIDDKALTFPTPGTSRSWRRTVEKALVRLGAEDPLYEDGEWGWEGAA